VNNYSASPSAIQSSGPQDPIVEPLRATQRFLEESINRVRRRKENARKNLPARNTHPVYRAIRTRWYYVRIGRGRISSVYRLRSVSDRNAFVARHTKNNGISVRCAIKRLLRTYMNVGPYDSYDMDGTM
jgi:hypothetical protein